MRYSRDPRTHRARDLCYAPNRRTRAVVTLHIDLTIDGTTVTRLAVSNVDRGTLRGYRVYRWEQEHTPGGKSGTVQHHPDAGAVHLAAKVLEQFDRQGGPS